MLRSEQEKINMKLRHQSKIQRQQQQEKCLWQLQGQEDFSQSITNEDVK
jgi:hypothetical protein